MASASIVPSSLPAGTVLRYAACGDQPRRTLLVLNDGRLRCLRVGDKTWKGSRLPTFPSLAAFLDIVPRHDNEEFTVEWVADHCGRNHESIWAEAKALAGSGPGDSWGSDSFKAALTHYRAICERLFEESKAASERYLQSLGLTAGESPECDYVFYRAAAPPQLLMPPQSAPLAPAPAADVDYGDRTPGGMSGGVFGKALFKRADFQEPEPVSPPAHVDMSYLAYDEGDDYDDGSLVKGPRGAWREALKTPEGRAALQRRHENELAEEHIPQPPWQKVALTREQLHRLMVVNGGAGLSKQAWEVIANEHAT